MTIGRVLLILGVVAAVAIAWGISRGIDQLQSETKNVLALADQAALEVSEAWLPEALAPHAWEVFYANLQNDDFARWDSYRMLGQRTSLSACTLVGMKITNGLGHAAANCPATFENGDAILSLQMSNQSGTWRVTDLKIQL